MRFFISALAITSCLPGTASANDEAHAEWLGQFEPKVIYGHDNRKDVCQETDEARRMLATTTLALIPKDKVLFRKDYYSIKGTSYKSEYNLCSSERFSNQSVAADCSGFLVAPDTVVTAGHCVWDQASCEGYKYVFDFAYNPREPRHLPHDDVYSCKSLVHSEVEPGSDFAVLKLDRPVPNRAVAQVRRSGAITVGEPLVVIGHPAGLPTKISAGASVRAIDSDGFIITNTDTYGGNSGSAVFNDRTHEVEGILVEGELDFVTKGNCTVSNHCTDDGCQGESLTPMSVVLPYLDQPAPPES